MKYFIIILVSFVFFMLSEIIADKIIEFISFIYKCKRLEKEEKKCYNDTNKD